MKHHFLLVCMMLVAASCNASANGEDKNTTTPGGETPTVTPAVDLTDKGERMRVALKGDDLYVSGCLDSSSDIIYHFRKCMVNDLFTFLTVGSAPNGNSLERLDPTSRTTVTFNSAAASDNIGPFWLAGGNYFVGGNHKWTDDITKTASTVSWTAKAGDRILKDGDDVYASEITITVENNLYDPIVAPAAGAGILSSVLAKEKVVYSVQGKSLKVSCSHKFTRDVEVYRYYGMQSMFMNETRMMVPGSSIDSWTDCPQSTATISVPVTECPDLSMFVERNADKYFQTTYLSSEGLGSHKYVTSGHPSYIYANYGSAGNGKAYHVLIGGHAVSSEETLSWEGTYIWGQKAKVDDSDIFCHEGRLDGRRALFICCSVPVTRTIKMSGFTAETPFEIADSRGDISVSARKDGISVDAAKAGYVIVLY